MASVLVIEFQELDFHVLEDHLFRQHHATFEGGTLHSNALRPLHDLLKDVGCPALSANNVLALQHVFARVRPADRTDFLFVECVFDERH